MSDAASTDDNGTPLDAALYYASLGWRVVPIRPGQKRPPMESWQHAASTDEKVIRNWYRGLYRGFGIGIATGSASGIFVLDVDVSEGKHGDDTLGELERTHGKLPDTVRAITGTNGGHIYFRWPAGHDIRNNAGTRLGPGLDIRGEGGQVVAAPTIHPNGRPYAWEAGYGPDEIAVADAPDWLIELLTAPPPAPAPAPKVGGIPLTDPGDSIAEHVNRSHDWHTLLIGDGWQLHSTDRTSGDTHWTRPGKEVRDGSSAILHEPDGPLVVFSTDPGLAALHRPGDANRTGDGWSFSRFGYIAATRWDGDRSACASAYRTALNATQAQIVTADRGQVAYALLTGETTPADDLDAFCVDWHEFWQTDHTASDWLAEPVIATGRGHAIVAAGGTGKSLLALWIAAHVATGRRLFGNDIGARHVLYLDYEMTPADLAERLEAMGFGPDTDLSRLHYALLPALPPLDTARGGDLVRRLAVHHGAEVVIVDTYSRAVEGDENEADTTLSFYRHTGQALKAAGIAYARIDHTGKDPTKGSRGSSAKNDDVDVVWQMTLTDDGYKLKNTKRRMGWVPAEVDIIKREDPLLRFDVSVMGSVPAGTHEVMQLLDRLGVPHGASQRKAAQALRDAGHAARNDTIRAALKARRNVLLGAPQIRGAVDSSDDGRALRRGGAQSANILVDERAQSGARWGAVPVADVGASVSIDTGATSAPGSLPVDNDDFNLF